MIDVSIKALRELGISLYEPQGKMKPLQELIEEIKNEYYKISPDSKPLLTIELENENSIPKVFYKGEEITNKINVSFDWETDTEIMGGLSYVIEHVEKDGKQTAVNMIGRKTKGHM